MAAADLAAAALRSSITISGGVHPPKTGMYGGMDLLRKAGADLRSRNKTMRPRLCQAFADSRFSSQECKVRKCLTVARRLKRLIPNSNKQY